MIQNFRNKQSRVEAFHLNAENAAKCLFDHERVPFGMSSVSGGGHPDRRLVYHYVIIVSADAGMPTRNVVRARYKMGEAGDWVVKDGDKLTVYSDEDFRRLFEEVPAEEPQTYSAPFLWPCREGSVEEAGYEFANAKTPEFQKEWWDILVYRIRQQQS